jgi:hypothetical protein
VCDWNYLDFRRRIPPAPRLRTSRTLVKCWSKRVLGRPGGGGRRPPRLPEEARPQRSTRTIFDRYIYPPPSLLAAGRRTGTPKPPSTTAHTHGNPGANTLNGRMLNEAPQTASGTRPPPPPPISSARPVSKAISALRAAQLRRRRAARCSCRLVTRRWRRCGDGGDAAAEPESTVPLAARAGYGMRTVPGEWHTWRTMGRPSALLRS